MRNYLALLAAVSSLSLLPAYSQRADPGMNYPNLVNGSGAGSGAGSKRSSSTPARSVPGVLTRTYHAEENPDLTPEKALQQQNGAIQQYSKMGYQLESKKQWDKAEIAFQYVLKVSALRDGVGSPKMVPILQHLAVVTSEQGRMQEAVGFQERVFGFAKNQTDALQIINAGVTLTKLYLRKPDIEKAESTAQEIYNLSKDNASLPETKKQEIANFYETVMQKIHKYEPAKL